MSQTAQLTFPEDSTKPAARLIQFPVQCASRWLLCQRSSCFKYLGNIFQALLSLGHLPIEIKMFKRWSTVKWAFDLMAFEMFSIWEDKEFHIGWAILTPRGDTFQTFMKNMFLLKDILPVFLGKIIALVVDLSAHNQTLLSWWHR